MPSKIKESTSEKGWYEEKNSAFLYRHLANKETTPRLKNLFSQLADAAEKQADIWLKKIPVNQHHDIHYQPNLRTKTVILLISVLGPRAIKPVLAAMKVRGLSSYLGNVPGHATVHTAFDLAKEQQHKAVHSGNNLRAAVFGVNDGLISNACLILGIAGSTNNPHIIVLSGIAGLTAGAMSMAAGEYISVRSQRELFEYQIALEQAELLEYPNEEAAELSLIYQSRGLSKNDADALSLKMLENKEEALDTLAREELGLNPDELGSPTKAAFASFLSFAVGGIIPLLPFLFPIEKHTLLLSTGLTGIFLFIIGAALSLFTGKNAFYSGIRMLLIGSFAGITTNLIGHLFSQFGAVSLN